MALKVKSISLVHNTALDREPMELLQVRSNTQGVQFHFMDGLLEGSYNG